MAESGVQRPEFHYLHQWQGSSGRAGRGTEVQGTDLDAGDS